jgi:hypothetical protein
MQPLQAKANGKVSTRHRSAKTRVYRFQSPTRGGLIRLREMMSSKWNRARQRSGAEQTPILAFNKNSLAKRAVRPAHY